MNLRELLLVACIFCVIQFFLYQTQINFLNPRILAYSLLLSALLPLVISEIASRIKRRKTKISQQQRKPKKFLESGTTSEEQETQKN